MIIYNNIEQGTPAWFAIRQCKMTASNATAIIANGKGLETYILEIMAEYYSNAEKINYTNEHIQRGNELEPLARMDYELVNIKSNIAEVGFIEHSQYVGCSPDGLVDGDGLLEIKCPSDKVYLQYMLDEKVKSDYYNQMQMQMFCTGRLWCDYMVYNPNFKTSHIIKRITPDAKIVEKLEIGIESGKEQILSIIEKIEGK